MTLPSVFGYAFAAVLARWSGQHAFVLNVPLFDRHGEAPDLAAMIADFTTLLLVECEVRPHACVADAVRAFQACLHGAIAHAAYPALEVLRDARRQGAPRAAPVVFSSNLGDEPFVPAAFREAFGDLHDMISQTPQVWLDHQLYRVTDGVLLAWDSVDGLFPDGMLDAMFDAYIAFVQALCDRDWLQPAAVALPPAQRRVRDALNAVPAPAGRARCTAISSRSPRASRPPSRCGAASARSRAASSPRRRSRSRRACARRASATARRSRSVCRADRRRSPRRSACSRRARAMCPSTSRSRPRGAR